MIFLYIIQRLPLFFLLKNQNIRHSFALWILGSRPLKGRGHSSVCNGSFLLKERPVGFKGKTGICNHLNFNFLPNQNSVPVTHGIFSNKHGGICRTKRQSVYNKFQQFKIQIPWLQSRLPSSHIWRGICMSGTDKV